MTHVVTAANVVPTWVESISTNLQITPLQEVQAPAQLDGYSFVVPQSEYDGKH
jgi:hypothetical protein